SDGCFAHILKRRFRRFSQNDALYRLLEICVHLRNLRFDLHLIHAYATGAAKMIESTTSRTPPKPGMICDASFRSQSRLMSDSAKSPKAPARPTVKPKPTACRSLNPAPSRFNPMAT